MKKYIKILALLLISFGLKAQTLLPSELPFPKSPTSFYWIGWLKGDSGIINAVRDTTFRPRYPGTQIVWQHAGTDTLLWWWTGQRWLSPTTSGGGGGNFNSFNFTPQNGITGTVTQANGPNVNLALGTNLNGIVNANGTGFGTVTIGSGLTYVGNVLSANTGTSLNALISGNGTNFIATTIGAGLSYSTVTHTLTNTIVNNNQLINGAGYITNITGLVTAGSNISITGNGTSGTPYVINSTGGGSITGAGNLAPLFTTSVSAGTINFAFQNPSAFTIFGNPQGISAAPMYYGVNSTLIFSGNLLGVNPSAPLNFYQTITQIDSFTFTLNTPGGRHDTVRIQLPTNGFVSILQNGLNLTGSVGEMGGPLLHNTLINGGGFSLGIQGNRFAKGMGAAVAAANNLTLGGDGNLFSITGVTQINAITTTNWQPGAEISFIFTGTPTLKNNTIGGGGTAPMLLAGGIDYTAAPGDLIGLQYDGSFWHETNRKLASSGGVYVFSNGLTETPAAHPKWGGTLLQNTTIAGAGFYSAFNGGRLESGAGAAIVAANNLVAGNDGNQFSVTGNTQINAITTTNWQAGSHIELIFTGTPTLKNNTAGGVNTAPMLLAGSIDYTAAAGDLIGLSFDGTVWHETNRKLAGSVTAITLNNGLTLTGTVGQLGGTLIQTTTVAAGSNQMLWTGTNGAKVMDIASTGGGFALHVSSTADAFRADATGTAVYGTGSIGVFGFSSTASGEGGFFQSTGGGNGAAVGASAGAPGTFIYDGTYTDASTTTVVPLNRLIRSSSGTAANGIGQSFDFYLQHSNGNVSISNQFISKWTDATTATRTSQWILTGTNQAVTTTLITFNGNGQGIMTNTVPSATLFAVSNTEPSANNVAISGTSINGTGVIGFSTGNDAVGGVSTNGNGGNFTSSTGNGISVGSTSTTNAAALITLTPATTNTLRTIATFYRNSSGGGGANGIAGGVEIIARTTTGTSAGNTLVSTLTDATGAAPTSQFSILGQQTSTVRTTLWTLDGNGNITTTGGYIDHITNQAGGTYTIAENDLTVIFTGTTSTWTFPTAVTGRRLNLVNNGSGSITYGTAITTANGTTTTTSVAGNKDQIQYDGTVWRKLNSMNDMMALMLTLGLLRPLFKRKSFNESVYNKAA